MIKRVYRNSVLALVPVAGLSAFLEWKKIPISVLIGGLLGLVNLKGLVWGVTGLLCAEKAATRLVFFSMMRFMALVAILLVLMKLGLINPIGILIGFTVVFTVILIEGVREARTAGKDNDIISS